MLYSLYANLSMISHHKEIKPENFILTHKALHYLVLLNLLTMAYLSLSFSLFIPFILIFCQNQCILSSLLIHNILWIWNTLPKAHGSLNTIMVISFLFSCFCFWSNITFSIKPLATQSKLILFSHLVSFLNRIITFKIT